MQRLHENDPTGHLLKKGKNVKHICLPGEVNEHVSPKDVLSNYVDGLLDPLRMDKEVLTELKTDLGSYGYSGQIMQTPTPDGGGIWKKWFIPIPDNEMDLIIGELVNYGTDWDTAYTEKETNSASAYITSGKRNEKIYI